MGPWPSQPLRFPPSFPGLSGPSYSLFGLSNRIRSLDGRLEQHNCFRSNLANIALSNRENASTTSNTGGQELKQ